MRAQIMKFNALMCHCGYISRPEAINLEINWQFLLSQQKRSALKA